MRFVWLFVARHGTIIARYLVFYLATTLTEKEANLSQVYCFDR